jgi:hypothetical protein
MYPHGWGKNIRNHFQHILKNSFVKYFERTGETMPLFCKRRRFEYLHWHKVVVRWFAATTEQNG